MQKLIEQICDRHGLTTHVFSVRTYRCKKCRYETVKRCRKNYKVRAIKILGGKCVKCGYSKCTAALEFHHIDGEDKDFGIGTVRSNKKWSEIEKELKKCILLCSNCHKEHHYLEYDEVEIFIPKKKKSKKKPSKSIFEEEVKNSSYIELAKKYNVSYSTIKNWLISYDLRISKCGK